MKVKISMCVCVCGGGGEGRSTPFTDLRATVCHVNNKSSMCEGLKCTTESTRWMSQYQP